MYLLLLDSIFAFNNKVANDNKAAHRIFCLT